MSIEEQTSSMIGIAKLVPVIAAISLLLGGTGLTGHKEYEIGPNLTRVIVYCFTMYFIFRLVEQLGSLALHIDSAEKEREK